jgi:carboxymethylenebutenolidase
MEVPELDAAVMYYGHPVTEPEQLKSIRAPLLAIFGTKDPSIPEDMVDAFQQALDTAGVRHRVLRFEAEHAFANPSAKNYDARSASGAWQQAQLFLENHLTR